MNLINLKTVGEALCLGSAIKPQNNRGVKPLLQLTKKVGIDRRSKAKPTFLTSRFLTAFTLIFSVSSLSAAYDYDDDIAPLLEKYCVQCHGPDKQKSRYRLDTYEHLLTPGSSDEKPIAKFYPMQSPLVEYLLLPKEDEYAMPPEDEETPTAEEVLKIVHWIYEGAPSKMAEQAALPIDQMLEEAQLAAVNILRSKGAIIHKQGKKDSTLVADLQQLKNPREPECIQALNALAPLIAVLRLPGHSEVDSILKAIDELPKLVQLDIRMSDASDSVVDRIKQMESLQSLNLSGTRITDTGLTSLQVPAQGKLFTGHSPISSMGLKRFEERYPDVQITGNVNLDAVRRITELAKQNSTTFDPEAKDNLKKIDENQIPNGIQVSDSGIRHSFLVCGRVTAIFNEDSEVVWSTPGNARDGMVLENGNILLSINNIAKEFRKGTQEVVWSYALDPQNKELGTVNRLPNGNTLVIERGILPRLLEVDPKGEIVIDVPLQPETENNHMQTRMARKLENGNYLVPHLLAFKVKEYTPTGEVVNVIHTDLPELGGLEAENWPFTAIRLPNGNTVVNLTHGNKTAEFAPDGSVVWVCDNNDAEGRFADPCGGQRLPNGNTLISSYGQRNPQRVKLFEVNEEKEVVWEFFHPTVKGHQVHVLTTNGKSVDPLYR